MPDTVTSAELMRRFEEVARRLDTLASTLETGYIRKDAHEQGVRAIEAMHVAGIRLIETQMLADRNAAERAAVENAQDIKDARAEAQREVKALKADRHSDLAWKRQVTGILLAGMIGLATTAGVAVFNLLTGG